MNINMDLIRPISPQQAYEKTNRGVNVGLITVVNRLIVELMIDHTTSLDLTSVKREYRAKGFTAPLMFDRRTIQNVATEYRNLGWNVTVSEAEIDKIHYDAVLTFKIPLEDQKSKSWFVKKLPTILGVIAVIAVLFIELLSINSR